MRSTHGAYLVKEGEGLLDLRLVEVWLQLVPSAAGTTSGTAGVMTSACRGDSQVRSRTQASSAQTNQDDHRR